jgi:putative secretion ATPase (PEP-CTERM system associated)
MYTSFFSFTQKPFQLTPDPEFLFMSRVHKRALTYLKYGIADNSGFILLTGEIGTGKTTILRTLLKHIPEEIRIARVNNTKVSSDQLIAMINEDFGLDSKKKDKTQMLSELSDFLIKGYAQGGRSMIIIDEAQNLSPELLEEIRMLSNLETDKSKLLQIVLIGQPELNLTLSRPELEQLRQRIAINTFISHLSREETEEYIQHRLRVAGNEGAVRFDEGVMDAVYDFSKGIPRLINILCEFTLLAAYADEKKTIGMHLIKEIICDLVNEKPEARAAALNAQRPVKQGIDEKIRKALSSIHLRLQNLESSLREMREGNDAISGDGKQWDAKEAELSRKEEELVRREHLLLEKEEYLKRKEESIKYMFEQNMKEVICEKMME